MQVSTLPFIIIRQKFYKVVRHFRKRELDVLLKMIAQKYRKTQFKQYFIYQEVTTLSKIYFSRYIFTEFTYILVMCRGCYDAKGAFRETSSQNKTTDT